jgi:hypothetical protein
MLFFIKTILKNRCIAVATELFFKEVLMKKNGNIGLFYRFNWYNSETMKTDVDIAL